MQNNILIEIEKGNFKNIYCNFLINDDFAISKAVREGYLNVIKYYISLVRSKEFDIDLTYIKNLALINAVGYGHLEIVKYLISLKDELSINYSDISMYYLSPHVDVEMLKYLFSLSNELNLKPNDKHNMLIRVVAEKGNLDVVKYLISGVKNKTINIDPKDKKNYAIINAASKGYLEIVKILSIFYHDEINFIDAKILAKTKKIENFINEHNLNPKLMNIRMKNVYFPDKIKYLLLLILYTDNYLKFREEININIINFFIIGSKLNFDTQINLVNCLDYDDKNDDINIRLKDFLTKKNNNKWLFID